MRNAKLLSRDDALDIIDQYHDEIAMRLLIIKGTDRTDLVPKVIEDITSYLSVMKNIRVKGTKSHKLSSGTFYNFLWDGYAGSSNATMNIVTYLMERTYGEIEINNDIPNEVYSKYYAAVIRRFSNDLPNDDIEITPEYTQSVIDSYSIMRGKNNAYVVRDLSS